MMLPNALKLTAMVALTSVLVACAQTSAFIRKDVTAEVWRHHQDDCWDVALGKPPKHYPDTKYVYNRPPVGAHFAVGGFAGGFMQGSAEGKADVAAYRTCMEALGYTRIAFDDEIRTRYNSLDTDAQKFDYLQEIIARRKK
jgi:hypothetical protein